MLWGNSLGQMVMHSHALTVLPADIDECADSLDECDKTGFSICTNKNGSYDCSCQAGNFSGSGTTTNPCIGKK